MIAAMEGLHMDNEICPDELDPFLEEYTYPTMFGDAEVFTLEADEGVPLRVLYVGGGFQSATYLGERRFEPVFAYYRAIDRVFDLRSVRRMLMIGGGGFSYPKHLLTSSDMRLRQACIDVVEIDPAIVEIARRHFYLAEMERTHGPEGTGRLNVMIADGLDVLSSADSGTYDVVLDDSFGGTDPTVTLLQPDALDQAKRVLVEDGLYLINAVVEDAHEAAPLARALRHAFANVYLLLCPDDQFAGSSNNLVVATDAVLDAPGFIAITG